jgi:predicted Zn-dependent protease
MGHLAEAKQSARKLLELAPRNVDAQILLGGILLALQEYDAAIESLTAAVAHRPRQMTARYNLARALMARGRESEAKPHLDFVAAAQGPLERLDDMVLQAVANPQDAALRYEIGSILWKFRSPDDAARWMRSVLMLERGHRGAHLVLAEYYQSLGQTELANRHAQASQPAVMK